MKNKIGKKERNGIESVEERKSWGTKGIEKFSQRMENDGRKLRT